MIELLNELIFHIWIGESLNEKDNPGLNAVEEEKDISFAFFLQILQEKKIDSKWKEIGE